MPYSIEWEEHGTYTRFFGEISRQDLMDLNDLMISDKRFGDIKYQIADHSDMTDYLLTEKDIKVIGAMDKSASIWNKKLKVAFVTTHPQVIEMALKYAENLINTNWEVDLFPHLEGARKWVNQNL